MPEETTDSIGIEAESTSDGDAAEQDVFAADMWETPLSDDDEGSEVAGSVSGGKSADDTAASFDPSKITLTGTNPEDVPEEHRPLFVAAQTQFKGLQTTLNERNSELDSYRNAAPPAVAPQHAAPPEPVQTPPDPMNPYPYLDIDPNLTADQRMEVYGGARQVEQIINHTLGSNMQYVQALPTIVNTLVDLLNAQNGAATAELDAERAALVEAHGEAAAQEPAVEALRGQLNPVTGNPFTYREAYERVHGITAEQVKGIDAKRREASARAKRNGAGAPRANTQAPGSNKMTPEEVDAVMSRAGFE